MKFLFYGLSDVEKGDVCKKNYILVQMDGYTHAHTMHQHQAPMPCMAQLARQPNPHFNPT